MSARRVPTPARTGQDLRTPVPPRPCLWSRGPSTRRVPGRCPSRSAPEPRLTHSDRRCPHSSRLPQIDRHMVGHDARDRREEHTVRAPGIQRDSRRAGQHRHHHVQQARTEDRAVRPLPCAAPCASANRASASSSENAQIHRTPFWSAVHRLPYASNGTSTAVRLNSPSSLANSRRAVAVRSAGFSERVGPDSGGVSSSRAPDTVQSASSASLDRRPGPGTPSPWSVTYGMVSWRSSREQCGKRPGRRRCKRGRSPRVHDDPGDRLPRVQALGPVLTTRDVWIPLSAYRS